MKSFPKKLFALCLPGALLAAFMADVEVAAARDVEVAAARNEAEVAAARSDVEPRIVLAYALPPDGEAASSADTDAPNTTVAHVGEVSIEIVPAEITEFTELRVHTGRTRVREDGEVEAVYEMEYPKDGLVFLEVVLHVSAEGAPLVVSRPEIMLVETGESAAPSILAHSIATETGRIPEEETVVSISGQEILRVTFEVDPKLADSKLLVLGKVTVDTIAGIRRSVAEAEDPAGTTP